MPLHRVVFLPGVMGSALGHRRLADAPADCRNYAVQHAATLGWQAAAAAWFIGGAVCTDANTMWGRAGMFYSSLDGQKWFDLLSDTDGLSDSGNGYVLPDHDGLTRVEIPLVGDDFLPYDDMVYRLRKAGTLDVLVFAYDWRLSNVHNARLLRDAVTARWKFGSPSRPTERITIIAHSMGGLVARYFLESEELAGAKLARHLVTVGTPHEGAPEMYTHMRGLTYPLDELPGVVGVAQQLGGAEAETRGHLLAPRLQKSLCFKLASLIEMLPVYDFVRRGREKVPWQTTLDDVLLPDHNGKTALDLVMRFRKGLIPTADLPHWLDCVGMHYTSFAATGISTVIGYDLRADEVLRDAAGDGAVPVYSAHLARPAMPPWEASTRLPRRNAENRLNRALIVESPSRSDQYANPKKLGHQELMHVESVRRQVVEAATMRFRRKQVPDPWLPAGYLHRLGLLAATKKHQPGRPAGLPWARPAVIAIATITLTDPVRQPALRYERVRCPDVGWRNGCITGLDGVLPTMLSAGLLPNRWYDYVELPSANPVRSGRPTGGILVLPERSCTSEVRLATWNTLNNDQHLQTNHHHAESQLLHWLELQDSSWRSRIEKVALSITRSPCSLCTADLVAALRGRSIGHAKPVPLIRPQYATISWGLLYRNDRQGLTTTRQHIDDLEAAGWLRTTIDEGIHRFRRDSPRPSA